MKMKIFEGGGHARIRRMESEINTFLATLGQTVRHVNTAACQVAESQGGERYQHVVVTIWYEDA